MVNAFPPIDSDAGLLLSPNHFSWWDGFFIDFIIRHGINRKLYIMMLENQLVRHRFFRKVGAYSIDPSNYQSAMESLEYTRHILQNPANLVVLFPQGEIEPYDQRPFQLKKGFRRVIQNTAKPIWIIPVGFKIQYGNARLPDVFCRFGDAFSGHSLAHDFSAFETSFNDNLSFLDQAAQSHWYADSLFHVTRHNRFTKSPGLRGTMRT